MKRTIIALAACFGALVCVSGAAPVEPAATAAETSAVLDTVETEPVEMSAVTDTTAEAAEAETEEAEAEEPAPAEETEPEAETAAPVLNTDEIYLLANVMAGECYQSEWEDMIKVGMATLNRVDSSDPSFPDTLYGVVTQPHQMNYVAGRSIAQVYIDAATEVYSTWQAIKAGAQLSWDYSILFWGAGGGTTNIFRSTY